MPGHLSLQCLSSSRCFIRAGHDIVRAAVRLSDVSMQVHTNGVVIIARLPAVQVSHGQIGRTANVSSTIVFAMVATMVAACLTRICGGVSRCRTPDQGDSGPPEPAALSAKPRSHGLVHDLTTSKGIRIPAIASRTVSSAYVRSKERHLAQLFADMWNPGVASIGRRVQIHAD